MKSLKYLIFAFIICFIALTNTYAEVCIYESDGIELRCTLSQGTFASSTDYSVACAFTGSNVRYAEAVYEDGELSEVMESNYQIFHRRMTLDGTEFMTDDGGVDCNQVSTVYMDFNTLSSTSNIEVYDLKSSNTCEYYEDVYNFQSNLYYSGSSFRGCKALPLTDSEEGSHSNNGFIEQGGENGGETNPPTEFNEDTFCTGNVQGVFTTLGWVFFFLKILIPIILIVFGSIDFGKAMLSSKDDEIKKLQKH